VFADLDETIRQLLIRDVPLDLSEVDVSFEAPDREWSGRLSRPTINCFLYDVRENLEMRATDFDQMRSNTNGTSTSRRLPARVDATYQITIWARAPEDEHHLLWRVCAVLFRNQVLPEDILYGGLKNQHYVTHAKVIQPNQARANPAELWQSIDNRIRPALTYTVTIPLDPEIEFTSPMVFTRRMRVFWDGDDSGAPVAEAIQIRGRVHDKKNVERSIANAVVTLKETGASYTTDAEGRFSFRIREGSFNLSVLAPGKAEVSRKIEVPSPEYDLEV
jgi:uncharacterized protein DUF4255/carboxypeptidase family protein